MADYVDIEKEKKKSKPIPKKRINYKGIILLILFFIILSSIISTVTYELSSKIAVVPIKGVISTENQNNFMIDSISSRKIAENLKNVKEDNSIKAVLIDINSPGGSPVASEEISRAIEDVKKEKPVYAVISDTGASGGFWIGVSADKLYASEMSVVGSIGVTSASLGFENLLKEYNITYRQYISGQYKDMGTPFRKPTEEENEMIQNLLKELHVQFIKHVAENRNITVENLTPYAQGQIFSGKRALELNLIDAIGYYDSTLEELKNITNTKNPIIVNYKPEPTITEILGLNTIFQLSGSDLLNNFVLFK